LSSVEVGYQPLELPVLLLQALPPLGVVRLEAAVFSRRSTAMATPVLPTPRPFRPGRQPSM